jgi:hypothetical protein
VTVPPLDGFAAVVRVYVAGKLHTGAVMVRTAKTTTRVRMRIAPSELLKHSTYVFQPTSEPSDDGTTAKR